MKKKLSQKKQKYISKYTNEAYITYQFRLRKTKDKQFIKEISEYAGPNKRFNLKVLLLEILIKNHILVDKNYFFDVFIKPLFIELKANKKIKLSAFNSVVQLYNFGIVDNCGLVLVLEQFDAEICNEIRYGQYNQYFFDDDSYNLKNYKDYVSHWGYVLNELIQNKDKIHNLTVNNIVPIMETFKVKGTK